LTANRQFSYNREITYPSYIPELLREFFQERVQEARRNQKVPLLLATEQYVVNLLSDFLRVEKLFSSTEPKDEPIALMFERALTANANEQFQILKVIGDRTLYVSGFFGDSFKRKLIDINYYIAMGEQAYGSVSSLSRESQDGLYKNVFEELSEKLVKLVDLLSEISETSGVTSNTDLLRLYERWLLTKSERLSKKLQEAGILAHEMKREPIH